MGAFHRAGRERVNVFPVGERYLFKYYFEETEVFSRISRYYDQYEYRFDVPDARFKYVKSFLADAGYDLVVVTDVSPFVVVKRKFTTHPDILFEQSVIHESVDNFNCFVMTDREAVDAAVDQGARYLRETGLEFELQTRSTG